MPTPTIDEGFFRGIICIGGIMPIGGVGMSIPEWAKKMKGEHQAIQEKGGLYYLYDVKYSYDPAKKRSKTASKTYLGRLDRDKGLVEKAIRIPAEKAGSRIGCPLEYEASRLLEALGGDIREALVSVFGEREGDAIMAIGKIGVIEKQPEKRIRNAYETSYESVLHPGLALSPASISRLTEEIGRDRDAQLRFMRRFVGGASHLIFDGTRLVCYSGGVSLARVGYNHSGIWDPQVNLLYCFSLRPSKMPVYYMPFAGNKPDVSNLMTSVRELGLEGVCLICDKGFRDEGSLPELRESGLTLITPLRRTSSRVDYSFMEGREGSAAAFGGSAFLYRGRPIYYRVTQRCECVDAEVKRRGRKPKGYVPKTERVRRDQVVLYMDSRLREDEESDYARRMVRGEEGFTAEGMAESEKYFGTIALSVNADMGAEELFQTYKERELIEDGNKAYKHVLGKFASNKQGDDSYNGWLFLNHVSLMLYYRVLGRIKEKGLSSKYSVEDVIDVAKRITMQNIGGRWNENVPALSDMKPYTEVMQ